MIKLKRFTCWSLFRDNDNLTRFCELMKRSYRMSRSSFSFKFNSRSCDKREIRLFSSLKIEFAKIFISQVNFMAIDYGQVQALNCSPERSSISIDFGNWGILSRLFCIISTFFSERARRREPD